MRTMIVDRRGTQKDYEPYTITVSYEVRAIVDEWESDGWNDPRKVMELFEEVFGGDDIVVVGMEASVTDYKIERDE